MCLDVGAVSEKCRSIAPMCLEPLDTPSLPANPRKPPKTVTLSEPALSSRQKAYATQRKAERAERAERCTPDVVARSTCVSYKSASQSIRVGAKDTLIPVVKRAFDLMHERLPPIAQTVVTVGTGRLQMEGYIGLNESGRWDTPLLSALNPADICLELHHQVDVDMPPADGVADAHDAPLDETARELQRLEGCVNPYQTLAVPVTADSSAILSRHSNSTAHEGVIENPCVANEQLGPYYQRQSAFEIIRDFGIRVLYDEYSRFGLTDSSTLFTSSESKLAVRSYLRWQGTPYVRYTEALYVYGVRTVHRAPPPQGYPGLSRII